MAFVTLTQIEYPKLFAIGTKTPKIATLLI